MCQLFIKKVKKQEAREFVGISWNSNLKSPCEINRHLFERMFNKKTNESLFKINSVKKIIFLCTLHLGFYISSYTQHTVQREGIIKILCKQKSPKFNLFHFYVFALQHRAVTNFHIKM